ncbi:MAG: Pycsar system effector family protein [Saprospiraceae bacterium]
MTKIQHSVPTAKEGTAWLIENARQHVLNLWNEHRDRRLVYHNFAQAAEVARLAEHIGRASNLPDETVEMAVLAAWFHTAGYLYDYRDFAEKSAVSAEFFLAERRFAPEKIHRVRQCIVTALTSLHPKPVEAQLLCDAIAAYNLTEDFDRRAPLLRLEWELVEGRKIGEADWQKYLYQQLFDAVFYLAHSKVAFEPTVQQLLLRQKIAVDKLVENQPVATKPAAPTSQPARFEDLNKRTMRQGISTFFRSNYANHIHLSAIADNKAHIMISVNSILLSVAISMLTYQTLTSKNPLLVLPIVIFLVTGLTSLIFAVLSSRPRIHTPVPGQANPIFFGHFVHMTPDQYEQAVDQMLRDGSVLYGNMAQDIYQLGRVLDKKYRLLTFSYNVFMLGFVATVVAFLAAYFFK